MIDLRHIWWYITDKYYRYVVSNIFIQEKGTFMKSRYRCTEIGQHIYAYDDQPNKKRVYIGDSLFPLSNNKSKFILNNFAGNFMSESEYLLSKRIEKLEKIKK